MSSATAAGPPSRGVPAAPRRLTRPARRDHGLDLRPAHVDAAAEGDGHDRRRTTSSSGRRLARCAQSSTLRLGSAGRRGDRTSARSPAPCPRPARARGAPGRGRRSRSGTRRFPRSRRRGACSEPRGQRRTRRALPETTTGDDEAGAAHVSARRRRARAPRGGRPLPGSTKVHGWRLLAEPARRPASRIRLDHVVGERIGLPYRRSSRRLAIARRVSTRLTYAPDDRAGPEGEPPPLAPSVAATAHPLSASAWRPP